MIDPQVAEAYAQGVTKGIVTSLGGATLLGIIVVCLFLRYPNQFKIAVSVVWGFLSHILGVFAERFYIVNHIEGKVGKGIDNITKKIDGLEADKIKITLVRNAVKEAFIKDRVLIMRLQKKDDHGENLANIAHLYSQHLYSRVQSSLNEVQQEGIQLYTARSILQVGGGEGLPYLSEKYYRPLTLKHPTLQSLLDDLEVVDGRGLFYSVFIQEMVFLGEKVMFKTDVGEIQREVARFISFLVDFSRRPRGGHIPMDFRSNNIKTSFVLVASRENRDTENTENYVRMVSRHLPRDTESVYFMGWGRNISFVQHVTAVVVQAVDYLEAKKEREFGHVFENGQQVEAICILVRNKNIASLR